MLCENEAIKYWTKSMLTESLHICLVGTETTKVPALDLFKNSKSKTKIYPFLITKKVEHIRQKVKIWASWAVKWAVIWMAYTISRGTNT